MKGECELTSSHCGRKETACDTERELVVEGLRVDSRSSNRSTGAEGSSVGGSGERSSTRNKSAGGADAETSSRHLLSLF